MFVNLDSSRRAKQSMRDAVRQTVRLGIIDAAEELIAKHGLHATSLAQIAKRAGVAVGTLYNYFTDRDALFRGLFDARRATFRPRLLDAIHAGDSLPFEQRLASFVRGVLEAFESHRSFLKIAIENEHLKPPGSTAPQDLLAGARDIVAAGVREGVIDPSKLDLLPLVITGSIKSITISRLQTAGSLADDADTIAAILLDGVRSTRA